MLQSKGRRNWKKYPSSGKNSWINTLRGQTRSWRPTLLTQSATCVGQVTCRWGLVSPPPEVVKEIRLGFSHSTNVELGDSKHCGIWQWYWLVSTRVILVAVTITNFVIMTTKFVYATYSKLSQMGILCDKIQISQHWNYMGVVSRLPVASPRNRLMETHYVH